MCSSQVFHCLLKCLGPGTRFPTQRSVLLVSHTAVTLLGGSLFHKATGAVETQDPFVEVTGSLMVSLGVKFYLFQISEAEHPVTRLCSRSHPCAKSVCERSKCLFTVNKQSSWSLTYSLLLCSRRILISETSCCAACVWTEVISCS